MAPIPTTTDSASASAPLVFTSAMEPALPEWHADLTPAEMLMDHVPAKLVSPIIQESARDALKVHSGAPPPASASLCVDKTQPTPLRLAHANATQDSACSRVHAKPVQITTSFPTDTA